MARMPLFFGSRSVILKIANVSREDGGEAGGIVVAKFTTMHEFARDSRLYRNNARLVSILFTRDVGLSRDD